MVSALYVVLGALFLIKLSLNVSRLRQQYRVAWGDGGFYELQIALRIHSGAVEFIPIAALLLISMEMNGADIWLLHLTALFFFLGRLLHIYGLRTSTRLWRKNGTTISILSLLGMVIINLIYLPWDLVLTLR
ncbi:MAPEG family protein [Erwinia sp. ErVv1]|uniref:MAPEG family protein n=1 Tax=Erwinia sp. ErVv1 TaxID=1603299 RepID=UPI00082D4057|nr:MAPEG family protein [Erwinia sp. ErVv1]